MMVGSGVFTEAEILGGLPAELRPFVGIQSEPLHRSFTSIIEAFWLAARRINKVTRIRRPIFVYFGKAPFILDLSLGELRYTPKSDELINAYVEETIFLDCEKMMRYPFPIQVACILEEFVHAIMSVEDEGLVTQVVGWLYEDIVIVDGRYTLRSAM